MKPFTIFPLISLLFFFATWIFSADIAPQPQQPAIPDGIVDESCNTDSPLLPQHTVVADVDYLEKTVSVEQRIIYQNMTNTDLADIVLNVDANR
ncbi:MAG TPA: hypothetical protein PLZ51_05520, partial [Aggregatilineales bacterium]|nr:hypothetical protein [Aggregatilineales bacterium]